MQMAVVEYARNVCGLEGANSAEFDSNAKHLLVDIMPDQRGVEAQGRDHAPRCVSLQHQAKIALRPRFTAPPRSASAIATATR